MAAANTEMEEMFLNQSFPKAYPGKPLSTQTCKKCPKKNITIRRLQKNNSYLRKTAQTLRERLKMVRVKNHDILYHHIMLEVNNYVRNLISNLFTIFVHFIEL